MAQRKTKATSSKLPAPTPRPELSAELRWYLENFKIHAQALGRAPTVLEFANWIGRTPTPARKALIALMDKGFLVRDGLRFAVPT